MKINILQNSRSIKVFLFAVIIGFIISCNKELPDATPIIYPPVNNSSTSIGAAINSDTSLSFFKAAATKAGLLAALSDTTKLFTVFLPNNNAFRVSAAISNNPALGSINGINAIPLDMLVPLVQYHIIPGQQYTSADVPTTFPNIQLPSYFTIGAIPGTPLALNMSTFPSARPNGFWDNNIPVVAPDMKFSNGVVHMVAALVSPPSEVLKDAIYSNPNLTYFKAAIARADSGQTGLSKLDSLLGYGVTNMTVLAPNDAAFQTLIYGLVYGNVLALTGNPAIADAQGKLAVAAGPAFLSTNNITTFQVRGIIAYHFLATDQGLGFQPNIRVFSVNIPPSSPTSPFFITTLVNTSFAPHPGIKADATFTGPFVTKLQFTGLGTFPPGGMPYTGDPATAISLDNHCVNGVYYIIDKVLLPE